MHKILLALSACLLTPLAHSQDILAVDWNGEVLRIDSVTSTASVIGPSGFTQFQALAVDSAGRFLAATEAGQLVEICPDTGAGVLVADLDIAFNKRISGLAFTPDGTLYGVVNKKDFNFTNIAELATVDTNTGAVSIIGPTPFAGLTALGCAPNGQMYSWSVGAGMTSAPGLVVIDELSAGGFVVNPNNPINPFSSTKVAFYAWSCDGELYGGQFQLIRVDTDEGLYEELGPRNNGGFDWSPADIRGAEFFLNPDAPVRSFCAAKLNSAGCLPQTSWSGTPTLGGADDLTLTVSNTLSFKPGLFFFGLNGSTQLPFFGGTLCVTPPLVRTTPVLSDGSGTCAGSQSYDFTQSTMSTLGLVPGQVITGQFWMRDSAQLDGTGVALSNGVEFAICD